MKPITLILSIVLSVIFISNNNPSKSLTNKAAPSEDSIVYYDLEGINLEGTAVEAHYSDKILRWADISIFGETFQIQIRYYLGKEHINAVEKRYEYRTEMFYDVKSKDDIILVDSFEYSLNYNTGDLYRIDSGHQHTPVFKEFNKSVAYKLGE